jgi:hypothetical protein
VGGFNPEMRFLHEVVSDTFSKRYSNIPKYFDETAAAGRSTIIPVDTKEKLKNVG